MWSVALTAGSSSASGQEILLPDDARLAPDRRAGRMPPPTGQSANSAWNHSGI